MSQIAKKMIFPTAAVIVAVLLLSVYLNLYFADKFLLRSQINILDTAYQEILQHTEITPEALKALEQKYNVTIVSFLNSTNADVFNERLRDGLQARNIGFTKLWLWDEALERLQEEKKSIHMYNQGRLRYSILVKYSITGDEVFAISMNIAHNGDLLRIITVSTVVVFFSVGLIIICFMAFRIKQVVAPLAQLSSLTEKIASSQFSEIQITTGDEIETLANSFNKMSAALKSKQEELQEKNEAMEELLSNVAHEVKTPCALIQAYASGMQDGMDDGSFLDTIMEQNQRICTMVEDLLALSRIRSAKKETEVFSLSALLEEVAQTHQVLLKETNVLVSGTVDEGVEIRANREELCVVLTNLFTNACKYGEDFISFKLYYEKQAPCFLIENGVALGKMPDKEKIWTVFYVGEASRNSNLTGTGLGLAIVKNILDSYGWKCICNVTENKIQFGILFD